jgi:error-prone DNA polymerase
VSYVELHCHSVFSLLDGAAQPEQLVARAVALGMPALALTDHDDLGGAVRFATSAATAGIGGIIGVELTVEVPAAKLPNTHLVLLAETREGYGNLSTLITRARLDQWRGRPRVSLDVLAAHSAGVFALTGCPRGWVPALVARGESDAACEATATLLDIFDRRVAIECWDHALPDERSTVRELIAIARALDVPWVVTNDVHYAEPTGRLAHDVLCALKHGATLDEMGTALRPNGEWYLKGHAQMARRWQGHEQGLAQSLAIAERCAFRLADVKPTLPRFPLPDGITDDAYLAQLVEQGVHERWGWRRTARHDAQITHELALISKLGLAGYFLIVWDIVRFARREGVLCQGRGSAANSAVCYVLGITAVDPIKLELLFERFLSEERKEPPDIDIDFAHRDREKVLQYVYDRYGREHAAMVCEHITWRGRSSVRDAARVLGFSPQQAEAIAMSSDRSSAKSTAEALRVVEGEAPVLEKRPQDAPGVRELLVDGGHARPSSQSANSMLERAGLDPNDRRVRTLADIVLGLHQAPRHRGIHVGGFVLTHEPLSTVVPIEPAAMDARTVIQWEKDDLDPMGLVKIDLLGLGMLTVLQDCLKYIRATRGVSIDLGQLDMQDQSVYDDLCRADTVGVFQVESRAQMNTLPRLKPRCFYDLVVEVALIRPGPIQGDMVHPYLRRKNGEEAITYPHPSLEPILKRTLGIPLFQEQGMQVAIAAAGFTPGEADLLRKAMGHKRSRERMASICEKMIRGMEKNGIPPDVAQRIYNQINAFADYGFPESHAASFALIVYASAYLRHYYAAEFLCAMLNAQPMGFYSAGTLIEDARRHGVQVLPVDATRSVWDHTLECADGTVVEPHDGVITVRRPAAPATPATPAVSVEGETPLRDALGPLRGPAAASLREASPSPSSEGRGREGVAPVLEKRPQAAAGVRELLVDGDHARPSGPSGPSGPSKTKPAVRLGLRSIRGLGSTARGKLEAALEQGPFTSIQDLVHRSGLDQRALRFVAESGALDPFVREETPHRRRRVALWRVLEAAKIDPNALPLFPERPVPSTLPPLSAPALTEADYRLTGLSLNGHPMHHMRALLAPNGILTAREVAQQKDGARIGVAGLVICRQRPGTAKGFVFLTLEDETGMINVVITPQRFEQQALLISRTPLLLVRGTLQIEQRVVNLKAEEFLALGDGAGAEHVRSHDFR